MLRRSSHRRSSSSLPGDVSDNVDERAVRTLQFGKDAEVVCAFDRKNPAGRVGGNARVMKLNRIANQRRQFGGAVGDVEPLVDDGQAKRR